MTFSTRLLVTLVFLLSLAGTAVAHHKPGHSGGPPHRTPEIDAGSAVAHHKPGHSGGPPHRTPEIDAGSAVGAVGLLIGVGALLAERLRSK
jgi:hypothetical protein